MMRFFAWFALLFLFFNKPVMAQNPNRVYGANKPFKSKFYDSLTTDSLRDILASRFTIHTPKEKVNAKIDPFDALNNELYAQKSTSRLWFFLAFLVGLTGLILYIQNFPSQFALRLQSLINPIKYRELLSEKRSRILNGSLYLLIFNALVFALAYVIVLLRLRYFELNNAAFFILLVLSLISVKIIVYALQSIQAKVLDLQDTQQNITQRHINVELFFALLFMPVALFYYYNPGFLFKTSTLWLLIIVCVSIVLRLLVELYGIIQDRNATFQVLLYFCTFEILPLVIIATVIIQALYANG